MKARVVGIEELGTVVPRVIEATGTPVSESPATAYTALMVLNPALVPNLKRFGQYFEVREHRARVQGNGQKVHFSKVVRYKNLDYLRTLLDRHMIRRLKTEVRGMPQVVEEQRIVHMSDKHLASYDKIRRAVVEELRSEKVRLTLNNAMVRSLRLRQFLEHPKLLGFDNLEGPKFAELDQLVEVVLSNPSAKMVVWANFVDTLYALQSRYAGYKAAILCGDTPQDAVARLGASFDTDDCRIVIATPRKAGTGIDFLSRARTSVYLSCTYSYIDHRQSMNRVVRRTSEDPQTEVERIKASPATIIYLHAPGSVDDLVAMALERKRELAEMATPSSSELLVTGSEVADLL